MFTVREWPLLLIVGMWAYMAVVPLIEVAEQTVIQRVVPFEKQGRVFGFAQAVEASAAPLTTFLVAPIADFFGDSVRAIRRWCGAIFVAAWHG